MPFIHVGLCPVSQIWWAKRILKDIVLKKPFTHVL